MSDDQDFEMNNKCGTQYLYPIMAFVTSLTWSLIQKFLPDQSNLEFLQSNSDAKNSDVNYF